MSVKISFDALVEEAKRPPVEIDMPDGKPITVEFPDGDRAKLISAAMAAEDDDAGILGLFGEDNGKRLIEQFRTAPADVPGRLIRAVMEQFGVPTEGNSSASST